MFWKQKKEKQINHYQNRIIIALDFSSLEEVERIIQATRDYVDIYKVGSEFFTSFGPKACEAVRKKGKEIFLDLKYHDIPNTVAKSCREAAKMGIKFLSLHSLGGSEMIKEAVEAAKDEACTLSLEKTKILAVTILTSMEERDLSPLGITLSISEEILSLANIASQAGVDGLISSPHEIGLLKERFPHLLLVTPGIRPKSSPGDDQRRHLSLKEAIDRGADYVVVGRPVTMARDPKMALEEILKDS